MGELEAAKARIVTLEAELVTAKTPKQEDKVEAKLTKALERLEALEGLYKKPKEKEEKPEEEEEDGDQCPVCGHVLSDMGDGEWYCSGCKEYFEEEEEEE